MRCFFFTICLGAALASGAAAQTSSPLNGPVDGWTYFNRPGATLAQHREDIEGCFDPVASITSPVFVAQYNAAAANPYYAQASPLGTAVASMVVGGIQGDVARRRANRVVVANYENCMVVRGWRVVRLDSQLGARLERLSRSDLEAWLESRISAEQPEGEVVRVFSNELDQPQITHPDDDPDRFVSLSLLAIPAELLVTDGLRRGGDRQSGDRPSREERGAERERFRDRQERIEQARARSVAAYLVAALPPINDFSTLPGDASLVVVSMTGTGSVTFVRETAADGDTLATFAISILQPKTADAGEDANGIAARDTLVFAVPRGRWRIRHMASDSGTVSLCMGAPAFDVEPNDVVFAGEFRGTSLVALTPSSTAVALSSAPELAARLRPAFYLNGSVGECGGASTIYAYEIPGAPFVEDYHWGSRASATATVPAQ